MEIIIETIHPSAMRYDTVGDWQWQPTKYDPLEPRLVVTVPMMGDWRSEMLVAIHEVIEALLCKAAGITEQQVDEWDFNFDGPGEPGEHPACPYYNPHFDAITIERRLCHLLGLDWEKHSEIVDVAEQTVTAAREKARVAASTGDRPDGRADPQSCPGGGGVFAYPCRDGHPFDPRYIDGYPRPQVDKQTGE